MKSNANKLARCVFLEVAQKEAFALRTKCETQTKRPDLWKGKRGVDIVFLNRLMDVILNKLTEMEKENEE